MNNAAQVPAIDAYLRKAGGSERVSRLAVLFGVDEASPVKG